MKLLLTGFEPFGGSTVNPSAEIVRVLAAAPPEGIHLCTVVLPVNRVAGPAAAIAAIRACDPDAVLCLGQATGRHELSIERVAVNLLDYTTPDNAGARVTDEPVVPGGPAAYFVTLPIRTLLAAIIAAGVPAGLSLSAGTFLCNQVLYAVLHYLSTTPRPIPAGFIHVPALPVQAAERSIDVPSMNLDTMVAGVAAAIGALRI